VRRVIYVLTALIVISLTIFFVVTAYFGEIGLWDETFTIDVTEYNAPQPTADEDLVDEQLSAKNPAFVPELVDRRPEAAWQINTSAAVLSFDVPMLKPDADAELLALRPSYADAMAKAPSSIKVLPSINVIDGKAKQIDDGLFAAIDLAYYRGLKPKLESLVDLIKQLHMRVGPESPASAYLAAGLKIANVDVNSSRPDQVSSWLGRFESAAIYSKPLSFYTWSAELTQVFRFMRFFQQPLPSNQPDLISDLARAVGADPRILAEYKRVNAFYAKFTNPLTNLSLTNEAVTRGKLPDDAPSVAVFPTSRSRETELVGRLFPLGLPPDADLMKEIIQAIRQGKIDLAPTRDSGWYEYQIHALETFLLPEKGTESPKLLLKKSYKKRMLEAFQALVTKRRETHARTLDVKSAEAMPFPSEVKIKPRLRVEPCPSFYLRTARSYDFLLNFLLAAVSEEGLVSLHGLKEGGERSKTLLEELRWMRELFYGLHLLSAEDIGMAPGLRADEPVDRTACEATAARWLAEYAQDADLKVDTRSAVPIYFDVPHQRTRLWVTVGVRLAKLDVAYAKPPRIKPLNDASEWHEVNADQLESVEYIIAVEEFAEVEIPGLQPLTRGEFREVCNTRKTRPEIVRALSGKTD
jgi:hypothetical protein